MLFLIKFLCVVPRNQRKGQIIGHITSLKIPKEEKKRILSSINMSVKYDISLDELINEYFIIPKKVK